MSPEPALKLHALTSSLFTAPELRAMGHAQTLVGTGDCGVVRHIDRALLRCGINMRLWGELSLVDGGAGQRRRSPGLDIVGEFEALLTRA